VWPEKWLIEQTVAQTDLSSLLNIWQTDSPNLHAILDEALRAGKHNEFFSLSENLYLSKERVQSDIVRFVVENAAAEFSDVIVAIENSLE
jgi:hypothetical protein